MVFDSPEKSTCPNCWAKAKGAGTGRSEHKHMSTTGVSHVPRLVFLFFVAKNDTRARVSPSSVGCPSMHPYPSCLPVMIVRVRMTRRRARGDWQARGGSLRRRSPSRGEWICCRSSNSPAGSKPLAPGRTEILTPWCIFVSCMLASFDPCSAFVEAFIRGGSICQASFAVDAILLNTHARTNVSAAGLPELRSEKVESRSPVQCRCQRRLREGRTTGQAGQATQAGGEDRGR